MGLTQDSSGIFTLIRIRLCNGHPLDELHLMIA